MLDYHAVMIDETGCEFGVTFKAKDLYSAIEQLREDYPESGIGEVHTVGTWEDRQRRLEMRLREEDEDYDEPEYDPEDDYDYED